MAASQRAPSEDPSWRSNLSPIWRCVCPHSRSQDVGSDPGSKRLRVFRPLQGARRRLCLEETSASGDIGARVKLGGKPGHARVRLLDSQPPCDHRRLGPAASGFCSMESLFEEIHSDCQSNRWLLHVGEVFYGESEKPEGPWQKSSKLPRIKECPPTTRCSENFGTSKEG